MVSRAKETTAQKKARLAQGRTTASQSRTNRLVRSQLGTNSSPLSQDKVSVSFGVLSQIPKTVRNVRTQSVPKTTVDRVRNQIRFGTANSNRRKNPLSIIEFNKKVNDFQSKPVEQRRNESFNPNESLNNTQGTGVKRPDLFEAGITTPLRADKGFYSTATQGNLFRAKEEAKQKTDTAIRGITTDFDKKIEAIRKRAYDNKYNDLIEQGKKLNLDKKIRQLEAFNQQVEKTGYGNVSESDARQYNINKTQIERMKKGLPPLQQYNTGAFKRVQVLDTKNDPLNNIGTTAEEQALRAEKQAALARAESSRFTTEKNRINDVISSLGGTQEAGVLKDNQAKKDSLEAERNKLLSDSLRIQKESNDKALELQRKQLQDTRDSEKLSNKQDYDDRIEKKLSELAASGILTTDAIGTNPDGSPRYTRSALEAINAIKDAERKYLDRQNKSIDDNYNANLNDLSLKEIGFNNDLALKEIEINDSNLAKQQEQVISDINAGIKRDQSVADKKFDLQLAEAKRVQSLADFATKEEFKKELDKKYADTGLSSREMVNILSSIDRIDDPTVSSIALETLQNKLNKSGVNMNVFDIAEIEKGKKYALDLKNRALEKKLFGSSSSKKQSSAVSQILGTNNTAKDILEMVDSNQITQSVADKALTYRRDELGIDVLSEFNQKDQASSGFSFGIPNVIKDLFKSSPEKGLSNDAQSILNDPNFK